MKNAKRLAALFLTAAVLLTAGCSPQDCHVTELCMVHRQIHEHGILEICLCRSERRKIGI